MSVKSFFPGHFTTPPKQNKKIVDFGEMTNFIYKDAKDLEERTLISREKTFKFYSKI